MAKNYGNTAKEVLKHVGGEGNVSHLEHCSTRLRFSINDPSKVNKDALKATSGVMGVVGSGNQCQVVIGNDVIEVYVTKITPKPIRVFFVPMMCFIIVVPLSLLVLAPLGYNIGQLLTTVILFLYDKLGWIAVALLAAILPFMISMGMHKALVPYAVGAITNSGVEFLYMPASLAHNISEGGACLAVAVKTKDEDLRQAAISAGISGIFGITEPALYGVTLQHKKAMAGVIAGSFIGGLTVGLLGLKAFVAMGPGLAGMAMFVDPEDSMNIVWGFVGFGVSLAVSFLVTLFLFKDEAKTNTPEIAAAPAADETVKPGSLVSPMQGTVVPLEQVKDEVFSTGVLGKGVAVLPNKGELYSPVDGTVTMIPDSKHAISVMDASGAEILMHIGMDTVQLAGKGYEPQVKVDEKVKKGQLLIRFDIDAIKAAGYDVTTPVVVTNSDDISVQTLAQGEIAPGTELLKWE